MNFEEAKKRIDLLDHFDYSLRLFEENYQELLSVINFMCNERVGLELFSVVNRWKLRDVQTLLGFKLHNYVCAAKSLIDHSRALYRRVYTEKAPKFDDYESEVKSRFEKNALSKFVEFLRTYCQHEKLPSIGTSMKFDSQSDDGFVFSVNVSSSELLKSSCINSLAKKFINDQGENIDLKITIETYHSQVTSFYQWARDKQQELHSNDIELVNQEYKSQRITAINRFIESYAMNENSGTVKEQLCTVLPVDVYRELDEHKDDELKWLDCAIAIIENDVVLPEPIKKSLRNKAGVRA